MKRIVERVIQHITSGYGYRKGFKLFHYGIDLRSWDDDFKGKLPVVLPEKCIFKRSKFQKKWGWTHVFKGLESGSTIKFTHMDKCSFIKGNNYPDSHSIGYTAVSKYMKDKGYGDHLHFEVWNNLKPYNPIKYLKKMGIRFE